MRAEDTIKEALIHTPRSSLFFGKPTARGCHPTCGACKAEALLDSHVLVPKETVEQIEAEPCEYGGGCIVISVTRHMCPPCRTRARLRAALGGADT